jgi:photosystem II stability/assembly factor-like uncharacterized protein
VRALFQIHLRCAVSLLFLLPALIASGEPLLLPAERAIHPRFDRLLLLDAAEAGKRLVAVGERGRILVSDDRGGSWRYVPSPTEATLTAVFFKDDQLGWAVGHDATILRSQDGGLTWEKVHEAAGENAPLLDVWFADSANGLAVGAYGLALRSADGGRTWARARLDEGDRHLNAIAGADDGRVFVVGESGALFLSEDRGASWTRLDSPYGGSFFGALILPDGSPLIFGLRGKVFRGSAKGAPWQPVASGVEASLQAGRTTGQGEILLVGNDGIVLAGADGGTAFSVERTPDRRPIASVLPGEGRELLLFGDGGVSRFARGKP